MPVDIGTVATHFGIFICVELCIAWKKAVLSAYFAGAGPNCRADDPMPEWSAGLADRKQNGMITRIRSRNCLPNR